MRLPAGTTGLVIHDPEKWYMFEGRPQDVINQLTDRADRKFLQEYARTRTYFQDGEAHPLTWEMVKGRERATFIWRARLGILPVGKWLMDEGVHDELGGVCTCGTPDAPVEETQEHMFLECPQYRHLWPRVLGLRRSRIEDALGFVAENREGPPPRDKTHAQEYLAERTNHARKSMNAAWKIWCERNRLRNEAIAQIRRRHAQEAAEEELSGMADDSGEDRDSEAVD